MLTKISLLIGSGIYLLLTALHLYYTFFTHKLDPRKKETIESMKADQMNLTRQTSVWNAWIGFNGSHSLGGIFLGSINILLVVKYPTVICTSVSILVLNVLVSAAYLLLAKKYWFSSPTLGIGIAAFCYVLALLSALIN